MRKNIKRLLKICVIISALVFLVAVGLVFYLKTDGAQQAILQKINREIPGTVSFESFRFSLLKAEIEIIGFELKGPTDDRIAGLDRLYLDVSLAALFTKTLVVESLVVDKPRARLVLDKDGKLNLLGAFPSPPEKPKPKEEKPKPKSDMGFIVAQAKITDGEVSFEDERNRLKAEAGQISLNIDGDLKKESGRLDAQIGKASFDGPRLRTSLEKFLIRAALENGRIDIIDCSIAGQPLEAALSGNVGNLGPDPSLDVGLDVTASLFEIGQIIGLKTELTGDATVKLAIKGKADNPELDLTLDYGGGSIAGNRIENIDLDIRMDDRVVQIKNLGLTVPEGNALLHGQVDLSRAFADGFLKPPKNLDAIAYRLVLDQTKTALGNLTAGNVTGTVESKLTVEGKGVSPKTASIEAVLEARAEGVRKSFFANEPAKNFANEPAKKDFRTPVDMRVNALAKLNRDTAIVERLSVETGGLKLESNAAYGFSDETIRANVSLVSGNLRDALSVLGIGGLDGQTAIKAVITGTVKAPVADLEVTGTDIAYSGITIGNAGVNAKLDTSGIVTISRLDLKNQGSTVSGNGNIKIFDQGFKPDSEMPLNFSLDFRDVEPADFMTESPAGGKIDGVLKLAGNVKKPKAELTLRCKSVEFGNFGVGDADIDLTFSEGTVNLARADIRKQKSSLSMSGTVQVLDAETGRPVKDPQFKIDLLSDALYVEDFVYNGPTGKLKIAAQTEGRPSSPVVTMAVETEGLRNGDITVGNSGINANLDKSGMLTVSRLWLENRGSSIEGNGTIRLFEDKIGFNPALPMSFQIAFSNVETKDFLNRELATGSLDGDLKAEGSISAPEVSLVLKGKNLAATVLDDWAVRVGDLDASMAFSDGELRIGKMTVQNQKSAISVAGNARILDPETMTALKNPEFAVVVDSKRLSVRDFTDKFEGVFSLTADMKGSLKKPEGKVELSGRDIDLGVQKIVGLDLLANFDGDKIRADNLTVEVAKGETISGKGWYSVTGNTFDVDLKSDGVSLGSIQKVREYNSEKGFSHSVADGKIVFNIRGNGSPDDPQAKGRITVGSVRVLEKPINDLTVDFTVENKVVRVLGKQDFELDGQFNIENFDFSASLDFDKTDLAPYFGIAEKKEFSGSLTGKLEAGGNAKDMDRLHASADVQKLDLFFKDIEIIRTEKLKVAVENKMVTVQDFRVRLLKEGLFEANGKAGLDGPVDLRINGNIPLKTASYFVEELPDITGDLDISAEVAGKIGQPDIRGVVALKDTGFTVPYTSQKLGDLNGVIRIEKEKITVENLNGRLDAGRFALNGDIGHKNFEPTKIGLTLMAEALPVSIPDSMEILLNANLTASGTPKKSSLRGNIVVLEGRYYRDVNLELTLLESMIKQKRRSAAPPSTEIEYPLLKNMGIDIGVTHRTPFVVDNDLADLTLSPDLRIKGSLNRPMVNGRAQVDSGSIFFRGKTFEVEKGVIDFLNPYKIEPTIDIRSVATIRDWKVTLEITGTPDELTPKFTSVPHLEHADILSLVLFDKTGKELIEGEGGESQSTEQLLAELAASAFGDDVKKATGLDILEVEAKEKDGSSDRIQVTIGKELSRRMTVKYGMESKDGETVQRAIAEYKFLENILLNGFRDDTGAFGGELKFRLEFR